MLNKLSICTPQGKMDKKPVERIVALGEKCNWLNYSVVGGIPLGAFDFSRPTASPLPDSTLYHLRGEVYEAIGNSK